MPRRGKPKSNPNAKGQLRSERMGEIAPLAQPVQVKSELTPPSNVWLSDFGAMAEETSGPTNGVHDEGTLVFPRESEISIFEFLDRPVLEHSNITSPDLRKVSDVIAAKGEEFPHDVKRRIIKDPEILEEHLVAAFEEGEKRRNTSFLRHKEG